MVQAAKRLRVRMLGWLFIPLLMLIFVSTQLVKTVETFAVAIHERNAQSQLSEGDISTKAPPIPPLDYKNTGLVTLWFDDAWESQYSIGLPYLDKYGFKGALAVPTKAVDTYNYMTWLQVKRTQHKGWEITGHSKTHNCNMQKADQKLVNSEVLESRSDLLTRGLRSDIYVTPCGVSNPLIVQTVKTAYPTALRTSEPGLNPIPMPYSYDLQIYAITDKTTKKDVQNWLAQAKAQRKWIILVFHRLDNPKEQYDTDEKHFKEIIDAVAESKLPVVLPSQVLSLPGTGKFDRPLEVDYVEKDFPIDERFEEDIQDTDNSGDDSSDESEEEPTPTIPVTATPTPIIVTPPVASESGEEDEE